MGDDNFAARYRSDHCYCRGGDRPLGEFETCERCDKVYGSHSRFLRCAGNYHRAHGILNMPVVMHCGGHSQEPPVFGRGRVGVGGASAGGAYYANGCISCSFIRLYHRMKERIGHIPDFPFGHG